LTKDQELWTNSPIFVAENPVEVANTQSHSQLSELDSKIVRCVVEMFRFGNQGKHSTPPDANPMQRSPKRGQVRGVNVKELVFVELYFDRPTNRQYRYSRAAIVGEQVFKLTEMAGQNRQVDLIPTKIGVMVGFCSVAAFQNDVNLIAKRSDQREECIEELFGGNRRRKHRQPQFRPPIAEHLNAIAFSRPDGKSWTRSNRIGEMKLAVAVDIEVGSKPVRSHVTPSRQRIIQARDRAIKLSGTTDQGLR
jgi:hypothetical protein